MTNLRESIREGHYARKQIFCKDWLISWSHGSRFQIGLEQARQFAGKKVLDYGCGDGTFLALLMSESTAPAQAVGCEVNEDIVSDCQKRLAGDHLRFTRVDELDNACHLHKYDAIICMEVLEHIVDIDPVLDRFTRLLAAGGTLLISVPVETGLPFIVKQTVRQLAGWRGIGDYPGITPYTLREYLASIFAGKEQHIRRPVLKNLDGSSFYDHKGFNWMAFREKLSTRFVIEKSFSSPISWLSPHFASQAWFLLKRKS